MLTRIVAGTALALLVVALPAAAAEQSGAVALSSGMKVSQNPKLPKLNLTNAQREQIRKGVLTEHTEVEFQLKSTKNAKGFTPKVGAKLPKGVAGHSLPQPVLAELPKLRDYKYVKLKDQVLIVNAMTKKIVDVFSETQPVL